MINCEFIRRLNSGGNSDSFRFKTNLLALPNIGDTLDIKHLSDQDSGVLYEVDEIIHQIDKENSSHQISIYYREKS